MTGPDTARGEGLEESSSEDDDVDEDKTSNHRTGLVILFSFR